MSCQHGEDSCCQYCLEKVHRTTEDSPPPKREAPTTEKEHSPPEKTMTPSQKRFFVLADSSVLVANGAMLYFYGKYFFKTISMIFDSLFDTISTPTRKE